MKKEAYCRWHDKTLRSVAEHEQEMCWMSGRQCMDCDDLISADSGIGENEDDIARRTEGRNGQEGNDRISPCDIGGRKRSTTELLFCMLRSGQ